MTIALDMYLQDVENRIDEVEEARIWDDWLEWAYHKNASGPFSPKPRKPRPSAMDWPSVNINDTLSDDTLSVYSELAGVSRRLAEGSPYILRMRANFGVGNVSSAFGARDFIMPRETNTLPNVHALKEDEALDWIGKPLPPIDAGHFASILRVCQMFLDIQKRYPKIGKYVRIEQPDLQGPMDNLELMWGSEVFYALYDQSDSIHALLAMITDFIERFMDKWLCMFPNRLGIGNYFRHVEKGAIALRDDSAMNLSPEFFSEFIAPYDGRLLKKYGGIVHFCGRGDHFIDRLAKIPGLSGVNMSQPHLNNMEKILSATADAGINLTISANPLDTGAHDARRIAFLP